MVSPGKFGNTNQDTAVNVINSGYKDAHVRLQSRKTAFPRHRQDLITSNSYTSQPFVKNQNQQTQISKEGLQHNYRLGTVNTLSVLEFKCCFIDM